MPIMPARLGGRPFADTLRAPRAAERWVESLALVLGTATPRTLVAEPRPLWLEDLAETTARAATATTVVDAMIWAFATGTRWM